jgi:nanoRNase/pAp phosphatase (c-di-AMP/oligoRNAs hydrolase)
MRIEALAGFRTKVSVSKSITNRTCKVNIGKLMEDYGGGGMEGAGTCMMGKMVADEKIAAIVKSL